MYCSKWNQTYEQLTIWKCGLFDKIIQHIHKQCTFEIVLYMWHNLRLILFASHMFSFHIEVRLVHVIYIILLITINEPFIHMLKWIPCFEMLCCKWNEDKEPHSTDINYGTTYEMWVSKRTFLLSHPLFTQ